MSSAASLRLSCGFTVTRRRLQMRPTFMIRLSWKDYRWLNSDGLTVCTPYVLVAMVAREFRVDDCARSTSDPER